ncbi:unnamed protein product [Meganyctiphanes norvegica]|uniref:Uncharacterized protein n=1 Tax=Meganyctiphanes norvegica TaxID=48144 RepID=A0AAV2RCG8_MEGNR
MTDAKIINMKLLMTMQPTAKALAIIYKHLTKVSSGTRVEDYCKSVLGYTENQLEIELSKPVNDTLSGPSWNPFHQDLNILYKLLQRVCGLAELGDEKWTTPSDAIEYHLQQVKDIRDEMFHKKLENIDVKYFQEFISSLQNSLTKALQQTELMSGVPTSKEVNDLIADLDCILAELYLQLQHL